jgi:hypothetical protein
LLQKSSQHLNRFVREITYFVIAAVYNIVTNKQKEDLSESERNQFKEICDGLIPITAGGLADNWSQVRFSSSVATRSFYGYAKGIEDLRDKFDCVMIPPMCLNRYYVAEGVRNYSIETWKNIFGDNGKQLVCTRAKEICEYYILQSRADNHAVREASCYCISEISAKFNDEERKNFGPYVDELLEALIDCFKDESWPVRDAACVACGSFVKSFALESEPKKEELFKLWLAHLTDNINSVREHSAIAMIDSITAFGEEAVEKLTGFLDENTTKAKEQAKESV